MYLIVSIYNSFRDLLDKKLNSLLTLGCPRFKKKQAKYDKCDANIHMTFAKTSISRVNIIN